MTLHLLSYINIANLPMSFPATSSFCSIETLLYCDYSSELRDCANHGEMDAHMHLNWPCLF